jgi:hypothetical protein
MTITLPNIRKLFIPDPGYIMYDADLKGADAQVVAWEAEDEDLKSAFRAGLDVHAKNAADMQGEAFTKLEGKARDKKRQNNKHAVHACNYGVSARTMSQTPVIGWSLVECERFKKRWFELHPGIKTNFHGKIERELNETKTIKNVYGFQRVYFDRPMNCFTEALAWKPQSVVAITTYLGARQLEQKYSQVQYLLQNHDSITFQFKKDQCPDDEEIKAALTILTPYPDPLYIPWDLKKSDKSWGDCK